jgi:hypothetical protein
MTTITAYVWQRDTRLGKAQDSKIDGYLFSILFTPELFVLHLGEPRPYQSSSPPAKHYVVK